jgi:hypothetical protein
MNPHLQYSQAIYGRNDGRAIGIIDTLHLVEVAKAVDVLRATAGIEKTDLASVTAWFEKYLDWLTTSQFGIQERDGCEQQDRGGQRTRFRPPGQAVSSAVYPSSMTTFASARAVVRDSSKSTTALPAWRSTVARSTPSTPSSASVTAFTQCPQLMPSILNVAVVIVCSLSIVHARAASPRSRSEFSTTLTELNAIAPLASTGESSSPDSG